MAEEYGTVIFRVSDKFQGGFEEPDTVEDPAELLVSAAGMSLDRIKDLILSTKKLRVWHGYVLIEYDCADWRAFSELFVEQADGIEYYARTDDEYGTSGYYALTGDGERFAFWYDQDGDMSDVKGYGEKVERKVNDWLALLPEALKEHFPGFIGEDDPFPLWPDEDELMAGSRPDGKELLGYWLWGDKEAVMQFTIDDRFVTFELYREPEAVALEWLDEDRIRIHEVEAAFRISNDELTMTFGDGRVEKLARVSSPTILKTLDDDP